LQRAPETVQDYNGHQIHRQSRIRSQNESQSFLKWIRGIATAEKGHMGRKLNFLPIIERERHTLQNAFAIARLGFWINEAYNELALTIAIAMSGIEFPSPQAIGSEK
jgi:hypothetical protein